MKTIIAVLSILDATAASAGDSIDTRVTFTVADDNILKGPEESSTRSPSIPNASPSGRNRLFFDDFEQRDRGFENLTHLVLYTRQPGFVEDLDTESALVLRAEVLATKDVKLSDDGSYIKVNKKLGEQRRLAITAFPISADRFRLGYSYDISWGGNEIFKNTKAAPGLRIEVRDELFYAFAGAKASVAQMRKSDGSIENDTVWGALGGAGINATDELLVELGGGFFDRGTIDKQQLLIPTGNEKYRTAPWLGYGGSAQVTYHRGLPIGTPVDFRLYKNDPLQRETFFDLERYNDALSLLLRTEGTWLGQTVQHPVHTTSTVNQPAYAADLTAQLKTGFLRLNGLLVFRTLSFITYNVPSFPSFVDFPPGIKTLPEIFASMGLDYCLEALHLTPGVILGVQRPASMRSEAPAGNNAPGSLGVQRFVFRSDTEQDILNPGERVKLIYAGKLTFRWGLSPALAVVGEFQASYDRNRRSLDKDPSGGIPNRRRENPRVFGFNVMAQSRF